MLSDDDKLAVARSFCDTVFVQPNATATISLDDVVDEINAIDAAIDANVNPTRTAPFAANAPWRKVIDYAIDAKVPLATVTAYLQAIRDAKAADKAAADAAQALLTAAALLAVRAEAKALLAADDSVSKKDKAVLLVILDEFNLHAAKINGLFAAIAAATSLANLQTRVGAVGNYPTRTISDLKTAVANKIDNGAADG